VRSDDDAAWLSSEPLDADPRWRPVPAGHLVVASGAATVRLSPLPLEEMS
jgi:glutamine amidotransferase